MLTSAETEAILGSLPPKAYHSTLTVETFGLPRNRLEDVLSIWLRMAVPFGGLTYRSARMVLESRDDWSYCRIRVIRICALEIFIFPETPPIFFLCSE
jgi:hypothetical protein